MLKTIPIFSRTVVATRHAIAPSVSVQATLHALMPGHKKKRTNHSSSHMNASKLLSQLLRTLGDHLDRTDVRTFHISWTPDSVYIDCQGPDGQRDRRTFTAEQLSLHTRFRRSSPHVLRLII